MLLLEEDEVLWVWVRSLMAASFRFCGPHSQAGGRRLGVRLPEAHPCGFLTHPQEPCGHAGHHRVRGYVARDDGVRADHGVVAGRHAAQDARAVADPDVVPNAHVALVDALEPDRAV